MYSILLCAKKGIFVDTNASICIDYLWKDTQETGGSNSCLWERCRDLSTSIVLLWCLNFIPWAHTTSSKTVHSRGTVSCKVLKYHLPPDILPFTQFRRPRDYGMEFKDSFFHGSIILGSLPGLWTSYSRARNHKISCTGHNVWHLGT